MIGVMAKTRRLGGTVGTGGCAFSFSATRVTTTAAALATLVVASVALSGCNAVFFQPDDVVYSTPADFSPAPREVSLRSADGTELAAWLFLPESPVRGVVVHFHGNAQNLTSHVGFLHWITARGFALVEFDYRGYGASRGTPSREGVVQDGVAALAYAQQLARTLPGTPPVSVVAQSLGGAIGTVATERFVRSHPGSIHALVLESTFARWRQIARLKLAQFALTWPLQVPLSYLVSDELPADEALSTLRLPILVLHGTHDDVVPLDAGLSLFSAAPRLHSRFVAYEGGHTAAFMGDTLPPRLREQVVAFLAAPGM